MQGEHGSFLLMAWSRDPLGAHFSRTPGPNRCTVGVPTPYAMCITPVSLPTYRSLSATTAAVSASGRFPHRSTMRSDESPSVIRCAGSLSEEPPTRIVLHPRETTHAATARNFSASHRLCTMEAPG